MRDATPTGYAANGTLVIFQSTRPMRDATISREYETISDKFQSTRPMRDATSPHLGQCAIFLFQSTRPMRDATMVYKAEIEQEENFNPRVPCGTRPRGDIK